MTMVLKILLPNLTKILLLIFLVSITSLVGREYQKTSKLSRQENRGIPLSFVTISVYEGPCQENDYCKEINVKSVYPHALIINIIICYIVSCLTVFGLNPDL